MLARGLMVFSSTLSSVVKQGWHTFCLAAGAALRPRVLGIYIPLELPWMCFCSQGPVRVMAVFCVCVWCRHRPVCTNTAMAGQKTPEQTISCNLLLQLPEVSEPGWRGDLGTPWVGSTHFWGSRSSWALCSNHLATANLCTLQKSHLKHSCRHMQAQLVQNQEASPQIPEVGKKIIHRGLSFAFLMVTLNRKGFKHTENKFQLIKSRKAVDFEAVWF